MAEVAQASLAPVGAIVKSPADPLRAAEKKYVRKMRLKPTRKTNRLENFDYSQNGVYFLTFCTNERKQILSRIDAAADLFSLPTIHLSETGQIVNAAIEKIPERYPGVFVDRFVVMPNHVHLLLRIEKSGRFDNRPYERSVPSVGYIVRYCKGSVTRQTGRNVWQKGFYDHIVRDERDYLGCAQYIENNPVKWSDDEYYANDAFRP